MISSSQQLLARDRGAGTRCARIRAARPGLAIVHLDDMSGPADFHLPADVPNITKPFPMTSLVRRIEEMLPSPGRMGSQIAAAPESDTLA